MHYFSRFRRRGGKYAVAGIVYAATLRSGQDWGGDFAMYLMHARNIANGVPYGQTGYIVNPAVPSLGPETYPPVYPLLLAPLYRVFGLDLTVMKLEIVAAFTLFLAVLCVAFGRDRPTTFTVVLVLAVAANPLLWEYKDHLMSDIPFLLFAYAALTMIDRGVSTESTARVRLMDGLLAGALVYLAYGTRQVGLVLVPCLILLELIRIRRPSSFTLGAMLVFVPLAWGQTLLMHADEAYATQISLSPGTIAANLVMHLRNLSLALDNGHAQAPRLVLFAVLAGFAVGGYAARLRERISIWEIFAPAYLGVLLLWTARSERFVFPLIPLFALYVIEGIHRLPRSRGRATRALAVATIAIAVVSSYASRYSTLDLGAFGDGIETTEARGLFAFVTSSTDAADVMVFRKPRVVTLLTGRPAAVYNDAKDDPSMWGFLDRIDAGYLILSAEDPPYWHAFLGRQGDRLERVFSNGRFTVYATRHARGRTASPGAA